MSAYRTAMLEASKQCVLEEAFRQKDRAEKAEADLAEAQAVIEQAIALTCEDKCSRNCCSYEARAILVGEVAPVTRLSDVSLEKAREQIRNSLRKSGLVKTATERGEK